MLKKLIALNLITFPLFSQNIDLNSGWNLIGFYKDQTFKEITANSDISKIYTYKNGNWEKDGNISAIDGVWAFSKSSGRFYFDHSISDSSKLNLDVSKISLKKGWNLISIPINSAVSPDIFREQRSVWKYNGGEWYKYQKDGISEYPKIDVLGTGEGFWVYSDIEEVIDISEREAILKPFSSEEAMNDFLKAMVRYNNSFQNSYVYPMLRNEWGDGVVLDESFVTSAPTSAVGESSEKVIDVTTTNTQEIDVDEADLVKHDGEKIFYLSKWDDNRILVSKFSEILLGNSEPITAIETETRPSELYLLRDKLIAIFPQNNSFWGYWRSLDYNLWSNKSLIKVYDVSNLQSIKEIESFEFDGNIVDTRVANGKLYLVSRYLPYIKVEYERDYESCKSDTSYYFKNGCYNRDENGSVYSINYDKVTEQEYKIIPTMNNESLISAKSLYAPIKMDQSPFITSILSFDIDDFSKIERISVIGGSETIYSSSKAIYIVSNDYRNYYSWENYIEKTSIFKFSIDENLSFSGKGSFEGSILNQFSLSEYNDTLRVASTKSRNWWIDGDTTDNMVFALQEINSSLQIVGEIRGLGKENETIRGVRFLGDRGYIVTFRQTDPLYVIDMKDPKNLKKGENPLEIDGYSTYFHPVNSELLLSFGVNANSDGRETGFQFQLFNVADFNNPKLVDKVLVPETQSVDTRWHFSSEAVNDHKAFTYRSSDNLFAVPLKEYVIDYLTGEELLEYQQNYILENYTLFTIENAQKYIDRKRVDEALEKYNLEYGDSKSEPYFEKYSAENYGELYIVPKDQIYIPEKVSASYYKNDLKIYGIDLNNSKIDFKVDISGDKDESYSYQRGLIFSTEDENEKRDWGLYILGGSIYLSNLP
jgi:uncharacterized secreted protein with C-terminal beta-propeller domain